MRRIFSTAQLGRWGEASNAWAARLDDQPELTLRLAEPAALRELRLTFDTNLSRELTISINQEVLARQVHALPAGAGQELPGYVSSTAAAVFGRNGCRMQPARLCVLSMPETLCDSIVLDQWETYGSDIVRVFEIRAYA